MQIPEPADDPPDPIGEWLRIAATMRFAVEPYANDSVANLRFVARPNHDWSEAWKEACRMLVNGLVDRGDLPPASRFTCLVCGGLPATEYHHPDYANALDVQPVCAGCHRQGHQAWRARREQGITEFNLHLYVVEKGSSHVSRQRPGA